MIPRRALPWLTAPALAQPAWPSRPLRLVIPFPPGGGTDISGRLIAQKLAEALGQPVLIDNRGGGGGNIGTAAVANAVADGYTLLYTGNSLTINAVMQRNPGFDVEHGFSPVTRAVTTTIMLIAHASVPARDLAEFVALARREGTVLHHGTPGPATPQHLAAELFNVLAGTRITHVPYRGTGPSVTGLLAGEVQVMFASISGVEPLIREGLVRPLGVTSPQRNPAWPDVPAIAEVVPGYEAELWYGVFAPPGLPEPIMARLAGALRGVLTDTEFSRGMAARGFDTSYVPPEQFRPALLADLARWQRVVQLARLPVE